MKREVRLAEHDACVGCAVCADVCPLSCIQMEADSEGFLYPKIDSVACVACGKCQTVCPAIQDTDRHDIRKLYMAVLSDEGKLQNSTSGGVFQALAEQVLATGGIVFGAVFDEHFVLMHQACERLEDLHRLLGSKYLQSNTEGVYRAVEQAAAKGVPVLFCGTPCQCDAVQNYYAANRRAVPENLVTCELMCHGVPSPGIFKDYVAYLTKKHKSRIRLYHFRYKQLRGWSSLSQCIEYENGHRDAHVAYYDAWHLWFGKHLSVRPSCYTCQYRSVKRVADITIGDFWSIAKVDPSWKSANGVSAVFVNTEKGERSFLQAAELMTVREIETEKIESLFGVPIQKNAVTAPAERDAFFQTYYQSGVKGILKKFPPMNFFTRAIEKVKQVIKL